MPRRKTAVGTGSAARARASLVLLLAASALAGPAPASAAPRTVHFAGEVKGGEAFVRRLPGGLVFRLQPVEFGWDLQIVPAGHPDHDLANLATGPSHGITALEIEGWHFRLSDNSGPNDVGPKNVNAPQEERKFFFYRDEAAYRKAYPALHQVLWPRTDDERKQGNAVLDEIPTGHGTLTIQAMKLVHLQPGERAGFGWMRFAVDLVYPPPGPTPPRTGPPSAAPSTWRRRGGRR